MIYPKNNPSYTVGCPQLLQTASFLHKDYISIYYFFCSCFDIIHPPHPFHLILHLQFFRHSPLFSHLLHQHLNFFSDLFINLIHMLRQFPGQHQILIPGTPVLLQKLLSHYSIFSIYRFFLIEFQIWQIIISMQCVAQSILFIINLFLHIPTTPFLCTLLYSS